MRVIFISATDTNIGKTYTADILINECFKLGKKAFYIKPLESGFVYESSDCKKILDLLNTKYNNLNLSDINYKTYALPSSIYQADIDFDLVRFRAFLKSKINTLRNSVDILFIEGAGGLFSPIKLNYFMKDVAIEFCSKLILISSANIGCINHILLNMNFLKNTDLDFFISINIKNESRQDFENISKHYLVEFFNQFGKNKLGFNTEDIMNFIQS